MIVPFPTPDGPHTINGFRTFGFSEAIDVSSGEILENKTGLFDKQFTNVVVVGSFPELRLVRTLLENALIFDVSKKMKYTGRIFIVNEKKYSFATLRCTIVFQE